MGELYFKGDGVKQNKSKAIDFYTKACDNEHYNSCNTLGIIYIKGDGVKQDKSKAKGLFAKACDGGSMSACQNYERVKKEGVE